MKTFYMNLKTDTLDVQSTSDASDVKEGCVQIKFELTLAITEAIKDSSNFKIAVLRALRDKLLLDTIWLNERHLSQLTEDKTLTAEEYVAWQNYWQELRDLPEVELPDTLIEVLGILPMQPTV